MADQYRLSQRIIAALTTYSFFFTQVIFVNRAYAEQIVPSGQTQTQLTIKGNITDITTSTIRGINAYNAFSKFDVNAGNIANLHVPDSASNLLNLVNGKTSQIDGILNSYHNGQIGGNVFFANPDGFVLGSGGVVNVGSLSVSAPTHGFMNSFFDAAGNPLELATTQLVEGTAPINANSLISIQGRVNALDKIRLQAAAIDNSGALVAGSEAALAAGFSDLVNTGNLQSATDIVEMNGEIYITAGDFTNSGSVSVDAQSDGQAGNVLITASHDITLSGNSEISAQGHGENSHGGNILVFADNLALLKDKAVLNVSGGEISGNGGSAELSAKNTVELAGGSLQAAASNGSQGRVLIDPENLTISTHILRGSGQAAIDGVAWNAGDLILQADQKITITNDKVVSTRQVAGNSVLAHQNDVSIGDSGNLTLNAPDIEMQTGSMLLANVIQGAGTNYSAGNIALNDAAIQLGDNAKTGVSSWLDNILNSKFVSDSAATLSSLLDTFQDAPDKAITLNGATIKGADITLIASHADRIGFDKQASSIINITDSTIIGDNVTIQALADTSLLPSQTVSVNDVGIDIEDALGAAGLLGFDSTPYVSFSAAQASVVVSGNSEITAHAVAGDATSGNVTLSSTTTSQAKAIAPGLFVASVGFGVSDAEAKTTVQGTSTITADQAIDITASATNTIEVNASTNATNKPIGITYADIDAETVTQATTGAQTTINGGSVNISAAGEGDFSLQASAIETGASSAGIAIAISDISTTTEASLGGQVSSAGTIDVTADFQYKNNITRATAASLGSTGSPSTQLTNKISGYQRQAATDIIGLNPTVANFLFPGIKSGKLNISGAISWNDTLNNVHASLAPQSIVTAGDAVTVTASILDDFNFGAISNSTSDKFALGGAITHGVYSSNVDAWTGDGATLDADGNIKITSTITKAFPWQIDWTDFDTVFGHLTGNIDELILDVYSSNSSKGKSGSLGAAVSLVDYNIASQAWLGKNVALNQNTGSGDIEVSAINDIRTVQAAGASVPFKLIDKYILGKTASKGGFGGAASFVDINSDATAWIDDGATVDANNLNVKASSTEVLIQLAKSGATTDEIGISGTLTQSNLTGTVSAGIETGATVNVGNNLTIDADTDIMDILIAGAVAKGGNAGVGVSISFSDVDSTTSAWIDDRNMDGDHSGQIDSAGLTQLTSDFEGDIRSFSIAAAQTAPTQASKSLLGGSTEKDKGKGKFGLGFSGDVSFNEITSNVDSSIAGGATINSDRVTVHALKQADIFALSGSVAYVSSVASKNSAGIAGSYSQNTINGTTRSSIEDSTVDALGLLRLEAQTQGEMLTIAAGGSGAPAQNGVAITGQVSYNIVDNDTQSFIENSAVNTHVIAPSANVELNAKDQTDILAIAGAVAYGGKAGIGASVAINEVNNDSLSYVKDSNIATSADLKLDALNENEIRAITAVLAASQQFAVSGSISLNEIGNSSKVYIDNSSLLDKSLDITGDTTLSAKDSSEIEVISGALSASKSASLGAGVSTNKIANTVEAYLNNAATNQATNTTTISASNESTIRSVAGAAGASSKAGAGVGVAVNRINNNTLAHAGGSATDIQNKNLKINAISDSDIETLSIGLGAGGKVGIGGSVSTNFIDNNTRAYIDGGAKVIAQNNVGVIAESDDRISVIAGSGGLTVGAAGVGASVAVNNIKGTTAAYIDGSSTEVSAYAKDSADVLSVSSGDLTQGVDLGKAVDLAQYGALDLKSKKAKQNVTGIAVNASATQHVESIGANVSAANNAAIGAVATVNIIGGSTQAYVQDATLNKVNSEGSAAQNVNINASNHAYGNGFVGNLSIAVQGAAAGAAADVSSFKRTTKATLSNGVVNATANVDVDASSTQGASSVAVGGSVGGVGIAGTAAVAEFVNTTEATIDASEVNADDVNVRADNENNMNQLGGAVAGGGSAVAATFTVGINQSTTRAQITSTTAQRSKITASGNVTVDAESATNVNQIAISGAGAGGFAVAGMAAVNLLTNTTEARINQTDVGSVTNRVDSVTVSARDTVTMDTKAGATAVGGSAGVGAGASVNILKSSVTSEIVDSTVYASNNVDITSQSSNNVDTFALTAGVSPNLGIGAAAVVTLIGSDASGDALKEVDSGGSGTLSETNTVAQSDLLSDIGSGDDDILSDSERAEMNSNSNRDIKGSATGSNATYQYQTAANISGSTTVIDAGSIKVDAKDKTSTNTTVGGVGVGTVGAGGGVAIVQVKANVQASTELGAALKAQNNIDVTAKADKVNEEVIRILAMAGGAGAVGLGAAVAVADVNNHVTASNNANNESISGVVSVQASDDSDMLIEAVGAVVGAAAAGVVISDASKTSVVTASSGASTINATAASIKASSQGEIIARTQSAAGGLLGAGNGAYAAAKDKSTVVASTGNGVTFNLGSGLLDISAEAAPQTDALAQGVTVSGGLAVGASVAEAEAEVNVNAILGSNNIVNAGSLSMLAQQKLGNAQAGDTQLLDFNIATCKSNCDSARANAFAASGGYLLGANATVSDSLIKGNVNTLVGANSQLNINGNTIISAAQLSRQRADTKSFSGGIAALGGAISSGEADTQTEVQIADGVQISTDSLMLNASGNVDNRVNAKAGSGGAVAGAAAVAATDNTSVTQVTLGNANITSNSMHASATQSTAFDHTSDSLSAGLLGASGAVADHTVDSQVAVNLAGSIETGVLDARSSNSISKNLISGFNVNAGAGGLAGGAAADSSTLISRMTSTVAIADDSIITSGEHNTESITLEAANHLTARDRAKLDSGGAIAIALADTSLIAQNVAASVTIGDRASLETGGDLRAAAYSDIHVEADANASTYGLAGAAQGASTATVIVDNKIDLSADSILHSTGETHLMAGRDAAGNARSLSVLAFTDLWNKTAFPVENDPDADAYLNNANHIDIAAGSRVEAAGDIYLISDKGSATVKGQGTGKDLYRQAAEDTVNFFGSLVGADEVSFDITGGSTTSIAAENVNVAGFVNAGIDNKLKFKIRRTAANELSFYEGDYPENSLDSYFDTITPTLVLTMTNGILTGVDSEGQPVQINYDATSGKFTVVSSENGLSTTFDLDASFNPMQALQDRLAEIQTELDSLKYTAGIYTPAEVTQREALQLEILTLQADIAALQQNITAIQDVTGSGATLAVASLAGINQIRGLISAADAAAAAETPIGAAVGNPVAVWTKQLEGLTKVRADVAAQADATTQVYIDQVVAKIDEQYDAISNNLIAAAVRIDSNIAQINAWLADTGTDHSTEITNARASITTDRNLMASYDTTLAGDLGTINGRIGTLNTRYTEANTELSAITGSATGDSAFQPMISRLEKEKTWIDGRVADFQGGTEFEMIDFTQFLTASSANIYVESDKLVGANNLQANRDTEVSVYNNSEAYLRISGGAEIPFAAGGKVLLNNAQINKGADGVSKIEFVNEFRPSNLDEPGPDLIVDADVSNYNGDITLRSDAGGVQTGAGVDIDANTVRITAGRDVILSYTGGIRHLGGDVKCEFDAAGDCGNTAAVPGIVAGNNVYIAGEYLNINAKIQSGRSDIVVEVNGTGVGQYGIRTVNALGQSVLENDGSVVYHPAANGQAAYFELKPQIVAGGYVDLYGHIMSTSNSPTDTTGSGQIDVMDGYGRIQLTNTTALDVVVDGLSAGTGVQGRVKITDLDHYLDGAGNDKVTEYTYHRDNALAQQVEVSVSWNEDAPATTAYSDAHYFVAENGLVYEPLANQHYSWENIVKKGYTDTRSVTRNTYFGLFSDTTKTSYGAVNTSVTSGAPVRDDLLLVDSTPYANPYWNTSSTISIDATGFATVPGSYDKDEYVVYRHETWTESRSRNNYDYTKHFVKADNDIAINFIGYSTGLVDLVSMNGGGIDLAGDIRNSSGTTTISTSATLTQSDQSALLSSHNLSLAAGSIGESGTGSIDPVKVDVDNLISATASSGDLMLEQTSGNMVFGDVDAAGNVWLKSAGDIRNDKTLNLTGDNTISGKRISLLADFGAIGDSTASAMDRYVLVDSQAVADGGVQAVSANDIFLSETSGDLRLVSALSTAGDVSINVENGSLVDFNPLETEDARTIQQLLSLWDEMEFLTDNTVANDTDNIAGIAVQDVAARNVQAYEAMKTNEYRQYWIYRNRLDDPSQVTSTNIVLSAAEASLLSNPNEVAKARSAEFARLHKLYGGLGNSYDENYSYTLDSSSSEYSKLTDKAGWSALELLSSFGPGLLKEISDTEIRIEDANATGNNVNISVKQGDIGTFTPDAILIDLDTVADYTELSDAQKLALLTAERSDVRLAGYDAVTDSYRQMWISTYDDVDVEVASTLNVSALDANRIYIGSEGNLDISGIQGLGDVRIRSNGSLTGSAASTQADVTGKHIILESASQSIGTEADFLRVTQLAGGSLTARAGNNIWIEALNQDLALGTLFAKNTLTLKTAGDVQQFAADAGVDIRAASLTLDIAGSFGAAGDVINAIGIGLNSDGELNAVIAGGAWINSPERDLAINSFNVAGDAEITVGTITSTGITSADLTVQSFTNTQGDSHISSSAAMQIVALDNAFGSVNIESASSSVQVTDLIVDGDTRISAAQDVVIGKLTNNTGTTDITAGQDISINSLQKNAGFSSMNAARDILIQSFINNGDAIDLYALNSIKANSMRSTTGVLDLNQLTAGYGSVDISVTGNAVVTDLQAARQAAIKVSGDSLQLISSNSGSLNLQVQGEGGTLNVSNASVATEMIVQADNIEMPAVLHDPALSLLHVSASGNDGDYADMINISISSSYGFVFDEFRARLFDMTFNTDNVVLSNIQIQQNGWINTPTHQVYVDNINRKLQAGATAQLYSPGQPFNLGLTDHQMITTNALVVNYDNNYIVNNFSSENSLLRLANKRLAQSSHAQSDLISGLSPVSTTRLEPLSFERVGYNIENMGIENPDFITDESALKLVYPSTFE